MGNRLLRKNLFIETLFYFHKPGNRISKVIILNITAGHARFLFKPD